MALTDRPSGGLVNDVDGPHRPRHAEFVNVIDFQEVVVPVLPAPATPTHRLEGAAFTPLATPSRGTTDTSVWVVEIAPATLGTVHRLTREEILVLLAGRARVSLGGVDHHAGTGDTVVVPPGVDFSIEPVGTEPLRALCALPVGGRAQVGAAEAFTPPWAL